MKTPEYISITSIICHSRGCSHITACLREATTLAIEQGIEVKLTHNEKEYVIDPHEIVSKIHAQHEEKGSR